MARNEKKVDLVKNENLLGLDVLIMHRLCFERLQAQQELQFFFKRIHLTNFLRLLFKNGADALRKGADAMKKIIIALVANHATDKEIIFHETDVPVPFRKIHFLIMQNIEENDLLPEIRFAEFEQ